jgi:hypothetical protein
MIPLTITLDGDGAFSDLQDKEFNHGMVAELAVLASGTQSGRPSIALRIENDDGTFTVAETTWALLWNACHAIEARYGQGLGPGL